uniref:Uncharacterized protein n=1 Tax=Anguilla anguilla TaxID=7936 RepID=A0A0E9QH36_ANGAN
MSALPSFRHGTSHNNRMAVAPSVQSSSPWYIEITASLRFLLPQEKY